MSEWISVDEQMPPVGKAVFVWGTIGQLYPKVGFRRKRSRLRRAPFEVGGLYEPNVTHWMPIPAPPSPSHKESR